MWTMFRSLYIPWHLSQRYYKGRPTNNRFQPGGALLLSTINKTKKAQIMAVGMAEHVLGWVEKGTHDYNKFIPPQELCNLLAQNNITCRDITGMVYNPLAYFSKDSPWQLDSSDTDVNYFLFSTKEQSE